MNKRIKELFQEAYSHFNKNGTYFTQELLAQKFAELIVRDIANSFTKMDSSRFAEFDRHDAAKHILQYLVEKDDDSGTMS